jgi:hypothetical protein
MALYASSYSDDGPMPVMVLVYPSVTQTKKGEDRPINPMQDCKKSEIGKGFLKFNGKKIPLIAWAIELDDPRDPSGFNSKIEKEIQKLIVRIRSEVNRTHSGSRE